MVLWLKQSTAVTVKMGPFLDSTDGNTEETALTISQADIRLSKNGGALAQSNNAAGATHDANGIYGVPLDATDTNTLGTLRVYIHESGALPVWQDFMVVPANVWDSLFGADRLQVDVQEVGANVITAAAIATGAIDADAVAADAVAEIQSGLSTLTAAQVNAEVVDALVTDVIADSTPADGSRPSIAQAVLMLVRLLTEKDVSGTTVTIRKEDGTTTAFTLTLNDATTPTSITRSG